MKNVLILFGSITFDNGDTVNGKATVHRVDYTELLPSDKAEELGEWKVANDFADSYLIPSLYKGEIEWKEIEG